MGYPTYIETRESNGWFIAERKDIDGNLLARGCSAASESDAIDAMRGQEAMCRMQVAIVDTVNRLMDTEGESA